MCLIQLEVGQKAIIDNIDVKGALKERLSAIGLMENEAITIRHYGWFKSTVQVLTNRSLIALRKEEAACIEVHKVA